MTFPKLVSVEYDVEFVKYNGTQTKRVVTTLKGRSMGQIFEGATTIIRLYERNGYRFVEQTFRLE